MAHPHDRCSACLRSHSGLAVVVPEVPRSIVYSRGVTAQDPAQIPWDDMAWVETTPQGERFKVALAPRGILLNRQRSGGDFGELVIGFLAVLAQLFVALVVIKDRTWKVGVYRAKPMQLRSCVFKATGLTQTQAEQEVERLRECIRRGDPPLG